MLQWRETPPRLAELSEALLGGGGHRGVGSIQWIERDGEWYVHDVNLRIPATVAGSIAGGLDMPRLGGEIALGRENGTRAFRFRPVRYVWFRGELMAFRESIRGTSTGRPATSVLRSLVAGALSPRRRLVPFDLTDPLPTLAGLSEALRSGRPA